MPYYHCSPTPGLTVLTPRVPEHFDKPGRVYMCTRLPMALFYGVRNYEYSYGYTREGEIYYEEYFPGALETLYRGKSASLYLCAPREVSATAIPNEAVSQEPVPILSEQRIPDVYEALLEQERLGALRICRCHELRPATRAWIVRAEAEEIRERRLLHRPGPMADYFRLHYPESWAAVEREKE